MDETQLALLADFGGGVATSWALWLLNAAAKRLRAWARRGPDGPLKRLARRGLRYLPAARDAIPLAAPVALALVVGGYFAWSGGEVGAGVLHGGIAAAVAIASSQGSRAPARVAEALRTAESPDGERR